MREAILLLVAAIVCGCGIPLDAGPEKLDVVADQPPDTNGNQGSSLTTASIFLVANEVLVPVRRPLAGPATVQTVVSAVLVGATVVEGRDGLRTAVPSGTRLLATRQVGSVAHLDLSRDFVAVGGEEEILAVAQIVLTATGLEDVSAVSFEIEGLPTGVPVSTGALSTEPVSADDYADFLAP